MEAKGNIAEKVDLEQLTNQCVSCEAFELMDYLLSLALRLKIFTVVRNIIRHIKMDEQTVLQILRRSQEQGVLKEIIPMF